LLLPELYRRTAIESRGSMLLRRNGTSSVLQQADEFYPPPLSEASAGANIDDRGPTTAERMRAFGELAPPLAADACRNALHDANVAAKEITHVIVVTCTGFGAPGIEIELITRLGLPASVKRTVIGFMGCHGALNGMQVASAIVAADPTARVLLCCVELGTVHFQYGWDAQQIVANALFADGAAAMVVGSGASETGALVVEDTITTFIENTAADMTWQIGDHGYVMTLSPRVPEILADKLRPWLDEWLARHQLGIDEVGGWAIHAGGPRIVSAVAERLELTADQVRHSRDVLRHGGNVSSATVLFILQRLREEETALPYVVLSFGPGLVAEAALLR
jgi:predicted naringenin-chalcone synthase